jgi:molybdopterin-guanine dinucleotide biosynthesis protein B
MAVPAISIVGYSESGKTTLIEKLIPALKARGYRVGSIKHAHEFKMEASKDSQRHLDAGSEVTVLAGPSEIVLLKPEVETTVDEIVRLLDASLDLVLCEGFKQANLPKIEVYRNGNGPLIEGLSGVFAIVSEAELEVDTRVFKPGDVEGLVDLLEKEFIFPQRNRLDLYVNGKPVRLSQYPRLFITDVVLGMVKSLKDIEPIKTLAIELRKETDCGVSE